MMPIPYIVLRLWCSYEAEL